MPSLSRATRCLATAVLAVMAIALLPVAQAAAPMVKTQAPGYYRLMLGDFEVTALFDGILDLEPRQLLTNTTPAQVDRLLAHSFQVAKVPTSVNGFLINTGAKLVLIDTGAAQLFGPGLGQLMKNLKASGYQPEQVDLILITHIHADHIGGLVIDGKDAFPNAVVRLGQEEANDWLRKALMENPSKEARQEFDGVRLAVEPYLPRGRFGPMGKGAEIVPGIKALPMPGHTPGHTAYVVESKGQKLVLWGDLMHVAAVQFPRPSVTIEFDVDSKAAAMQRRKAYADAAKGRYLVGSAHLPFPGLGHLRAEGAGYAWVPVDYDLPR